MNSVVALILSAAVAAQAPQGAAVEQRGQGAQVASAQVSATILRAVAIKDGEIAAQGGAEAPQSQVRKSATRVTYEFE